MLYIWILSNKFDLKQTIRVLHNNDIQHNNKQHNDTQHNNKKSTLSITIKAHDAAEGSQKVNIMLSVVMLRVVDSLTDRKFSYFLAVKLM